MKSVPDFASNAATDAIQGSRKKGSLNANAAIHFHWRETQHLPEFERQALPGEKSHTQARAYGWYFSGIGSAGVSACHITLTTSHRCPSKMAWMLLMPRLVALPSAVGRIS